MRRTWIPTLLAASLCAGCATRPMIPPPAASSAAEQRPVMAAAHKKADALRLAFHDKAVEQVNGQIDLNNGLLGLGITALGLALGKVHPDSFKAVTFGAASAYSFGQLVLSKPRQLVYFQGVAAVNCAVTVVAPLDISSASMTSINKDRAALLVGIDKLIDAMATLEVKAGAGHRALAPAGASLLLAQQLHGEMSGLPERADQAARDLSLALDGIAARVNEVVAGTVPESGAVIQILASLADIAPRFAPGLGLDAAYKLPGKIKPESRIEPDATSLAEIAKLEAAVLTATRKLDTLRHAADESLKPYRSLAKPDALRGCGVTDLAASLAADMSELNFSGTADETQTVRITGGVKPYVVRLRESPAAGIELRAPLPGDSNVEVRVPAKTASVKRTLVILDRADPPHQVLLPIIVVGASGATDEPAGKVLTPAERRIAIKAQFDKAQRVTQPYLTVPDGQKYTLKNVALAADVLTLTMSCQLTPAGAPLDTRAAFFAQLAKQVEVTPRLTPEDQAAMKLVGTDNCLAKP